MISNTLKQCYSAPARKKEHGHDNRKYYDNRRINKLLGCELLASLRNKRFFPYDELVKDDQNRERVTSYIEEPSWKIHFHGNGTVYDFIIQNVSPRVALLVN